MHGRNNRKSTTFGIRTFETNGNRSGCARKGKHSNHNPTCTISLTAHKSNGRLRYVRYANDRRAVRELFRAKQFFVRVALVLYGKAPELLSKVVDRPTLPRTNGNEEITSVSDWQRRRPCDLRLLRRRNIDIPQLNATQRATMEPARWPARAPRTRPLLPHALSDLPLQQSEQSNEPKPNTNTHPTHLDNATAHAATNRNREQQRTVTTTM